MNTLYITINTERRVITANRAQAIDNPVKAEVLSEEASLASELERAAGAFTSEPERKTTIHIVSAEL